MKRGTFVNYGECMNDIGKFLLLTFEWIFWYWPFAAAIALGLMLPAMVVAVSGVTNRYPAHLKLTAIFALIIIGNTLAISFSGRVIVSEADLVLHPAIMASPSFGKGNYWFSRVAHLLLMLVSVAEILMWCLRKRHMGKEQFVLWAAAMLYFTLSVVVSGIFGNFRSLNLNMIYAPIVFTAAILLVSPDFKKTLQALRWILLVPLLGSLVAIWLAPQLALETGYKGLIPGLTFRLAGLTEHANSLGVIAAIAMLLELSKFVQNRPNIIFLLVGGANLVLAQSKTAWVIAVIGLIILLINHMRAPLLQGHSQRQTYFLKINIGIFFFASIAITALLFKSDALLNYFSIDTSGLLTFTGRTRIWSVTWNEFLNNPVSGYGPSIWDPLYRFQHGMGYVGQAHNQYVQTLGQAGLIGVVSLVFYIYLLIRKSYQGWSKTEGFSFLIVTALFLRGLTESPMQMIGILDINSFVHLLAFASVAAIAFQSPAKQADL